MTRNAVLRVGIKPLVLALATGFAVAVAAAPLLAEEAGEAAPASENGVIYELSDPADTPPVNHRSDLGKEHARDLHDAEMYAEEYEKQQREEKIRNRDQLDRIDAFSSGAVTTDGITAP